MHESTISRVTTNKYVETPQGLFELKFFFHSGIASGDGEMVSSVSVKKMIQDLLGNEDATKPLSDQEVAGILKGRGLTIARRSEEHTSELQSRLHLVCRLLLEK